MFNQLKVCVAPRRFFPFTWKVAALTKIIIIRHFFLIKLLQSTHPWSIVNRANAEIGLEWRLIPGVKKVQIETESIKGSLIHSDTMSTNLLLANTNWQRLRIRFPVMVEPHTNLFSSPLLVSLPSCLAQFISISILKASKLHQFSRKHNEHIPFLLYHSKICLRVHFWVKTPSNSLCTCALNWFKMVNQVV